MKDGVRIGYVLDGKGCMFTDEVGLNRVLDVPSQNL